MGFIDVVQRAWQSALAQRHITCSCSSENKTIFVVALPVRMLVVYPTESENEKSSKYTSPSFRLTDVHSEMQKNCYTVNFFCLLTMNLTPRITTAHVNVNVYPATSMALNSVFHALSARWCISSNEQIFSRITGQRCGISDSSIMACLSWLPGVFLQHLYSLYTSEFSSHVDMLLILDASIKNFVYP